jgi:uncharacterized repeat protein (TIGR01451 family)
MIQSINNIIKFKKQKSMKNAKTLFSKGLRALTMVGLFALVLGSSLVPLSKANADVILVTGSIVASPGTICAGGTSNISWATTNATSITIEPGIGSVSAYGSRDVSPTQTTTYTMTLSNSTGGYGQTSATVYVTGQCQPPVQNPTVNISASPMSITSGDSTYLTWNSTNATSCTGTSTPFNSQWNGAKNLSGSGLKMSNLTSTTTFNILCYNATGQQANDSVTATVQTPPPAHSPTVTISANPTTTNYNGTSTVTWTPTYATSCIGTGGSSGWTGNKSATGDTFYTTNLTSTTTYGITCYGAAGTTPASDSVTVTVRPQVLTPTVTISANPTSVDYNGTSVISWSSTNATTCTASGGANGWAGNKNISGTFPSGALTNTVTYYINCTNSTGQPANDSVTVNVGGQIQNPTVSISANPLSVSYNGSSTVSWSSTNATSCSASGGTNSWSGARNISGTFYTGALSNTVTFYINCSNSTGQSANSSVTINVGNQNIETPPIVNLTASQTYVTNGGSTYINWNPTNNPTYCTGSNGSNYWSGTRSTYNSNFYTGALYVSTTYTMTCGNSAGSNTESVTVSVNNYTTQTCQDTSATNYGGSLPCNYFVQVCQDTTAINYHGTLPCRYNTYNYTCQDVGSINYGGTLPCRYNTYINNQPTVGISADSTNVAYNGTTNIRWYTSNATSCTATGGSAGWAGFKSIGPASFYTGSLTSGRTYTLTCTNGYGSATDSVFVNVRGQVLGTTTIRQAPTSLVLITSSVDRNQPIVPTLDNTRPHPGDQINYTVTYQNIGTGSIKNLVLRLDLPYEVSYMSSIPSNPTISGNTLIFNLGTLKANGSGTVTVRVRVNDNIAPGTMLNFPAVLSYVDPSGYPQSVTANVSAQVWTEPVAINNNANITPDNTNIGANVFWAGFFPTNLLGWLLLLILILILIFLARYAFGQNNGTQVFTKKTTTTEEHH